MSVTINILHLTDSHISDENKEDVKIRIDSLVNYIREDGRAIDIIAFTGDLTYSGSEAEFALFEQYVAKPLKKHLRVNDARFIIIPGNHDVNRNKISFVEQERVKAYSSPRQAEQEIGRITTPWTRLEDYLKYQDSGAPKNNPDYDYREYACGLFSSRRFNNLKGISLGVACLNSAWLCANNEDHGRLFLSGKQIRESMQGIKGCDLRIALCHHPRDWFNLSEEELSILDMRRDFSLILTGHLHKPVSVAEIDTTANSLTMTARAFFGGDSGARVQDGFHLYEMSVPTRKIGVSFRKYIRIRNTFDRDTDHAPNGFHEFDLPVPLALQNSSALIVQKLAVHGTGLSKEIHSTLSMLQGTTTPVFVTPKMRSFRFKGGTRRTLEAKVSLGDLIGRSAIICGDKDSGKTILLKTLAAEGERLRSGGPRRPANIYLIGAEIEGSPDRKNFLETLEKRLECDEEDFHGIALTVIVDGFRGKESEHLEMLHGICNEFGWYYVVGMGNVAADVLVQKPEYDETWFVEVQPWGPSRIKEFANKLFEGSDVNSELAYKFVTDCLRTVDLPTTPTIVSLYMSVFSKIGSEISSLSFLRLLEKIEEIKLGADEVGTVDSLYNRRKILQRLAVGCLKSSDIFTERSSVESLIEAYFKPKKLPVMVSEFLDRMIRCGILTEEANLIGFTNFVFFDYYLALAFKDKLIDHASYTSDIAGCARVASALSLFAGLDRENLDLAQRVMNAVEKKGKASSELQLKDLDAHIKTLIVHEKRGASEADVVAQETLQEHDDYDEMDEQYYAQRMEVATTRSRLMKQGLDESISDLALQIQGLHSFYSIFRNLENIDSDWKAIFLDSILDYHITTNFFLIDFYFQFSPDEAFRTFAAYSLTWTGHGFMASSLGNPTMCDSICEVIESTSNDFKKLLLLLLLSELGGAGVLDRMLKFVQATESRAATDMIFMHVRKRLVSYEGKTIPVTLINAFKEVFIRRQTKFGGAASKSAASAAFDGVLKEVKIEHWQKLKDSDKLTGNSGRMSSSTPEVNG
jgi:predicted phosphodiesterase